MTSDSGACLLPEETADAFADAAPVLLPFRSTLLARRGSKTRASSTSRCRMGDDPNAETLGRSITVCPFSPLHAFACRRSPVQHLRQEATARESIRSRERAGPRRAKHEPGGSPFDELIESQATDATPRRVHPAIDPKCHPPMGPIQCGSAGEELTPFGTAHEPRGRIESTRTRRYSSPEHLLIPDRIALDLLGQTPGSQGDVS